jgi:putative transposase
MPWKVTCPMQERMRFVTYFLEDELSFSALCREFSISRKTGYKIVRRFLSEGIDGLHNRSRARHHHPNAVSESIRESIIESRVSHPSWGPKKLRAWLERRDSTVVWPSTSTIGEILRRHGLTVSRRRSRKMCVYDKPFVNCKYPNAVWSADFKGWFMTGDGARCDPLTITDNYSRFLLRCQAVRPTTGFESVKPVFEAAFREYGLPFAIRTDNGVPFATTTVGSLSHLSIWWLKLGIIPERIEPGRPAQNGRHERMHRTLKQETASPPRRSWKSQQQAFIEFREIYNYERPHESINMQTPADLYLLSPREYPLILPEMTYPDDMALRWVKSQGDISWKGRHIYLSETLAGELVGMRQVTDRMWDIYFGPVKLAQLDSFNRILIHLPRRSRKRKKTKFNKKVLPMYPV